MVVTSSVACSEQKRAIKTWNLIMFLRILDRLNVNHFFFCNGYMWFVLKTIKKKNTWTNVICTEKSKIKVVICVYQWLRNLNEFSLIQSN